MLYSTLMKTITIQIGNSDNKLTQEEWANYVATVKGAVQEYCGYVHFFGGPSNWEYWQNAAWVVECHADYIKPMQEALLDIRKAFGQDSVAWTEGVTQFI